MNKNDEVIIRFIKERNAEIFETSLQTVVNEVSNEYTISIQYQFTVENSFGRNDTFYTALVIARRK